MKILSSGMKLSTSLVSHICPKTPPNPSLHLPLKSPVANCPRGEIVQTALLPRPVFTAAPGSERESLSYNCCFRAVYRKSLRSSHPLRDRTCEFGKLLFLARFPFRFWESGRTPLIGPFHQVRKD